MDDHDGADAIERAWRNGLKPEPLLTVSEWADRYRVLSQRASSEPGRWRTDRTPYLKEIMDCLSPSSPVQRVALMKGAQIGGTECGNCWVGYVIHQAPGPMMAVSPTVELAKRNSKQRIDPLIEESEVLRERDKERRSRDSGNTVLSKEFPGGAGASRRRTTSTATSRSSRASPPPGPHSHAAAAEAVARVRAGDAEAIMKGALHTDEIMGAVVAADTGLRTERRMSHVFAMDVPAYPRPLFITDAAINIAPDLEAKRDIVQNAIDLPHALGIEHPRVAILSAVETVYPKIPSTLDAAALCKMAERGQITGGTVDGPLAFDNAISEEAAKTKRIVSPVAGKADILVVPDLEAGNMLAKQLDYLAGAQAAGIVLGARVPIVLTSRADKTLPRLASCALALLLARHQQQLRIRP
jgi:hypothetical protein